MGGGIRECEPGEMAAGGGGGGGMAPGGADAAEADGVGDGGEESGDGEDELWRELGPAGRWRWVWLRHFVEHVLCKTEKVEVLRDEEGEVMN